MIPISLSAQFGDHDGDVQPWTQTSRSGKTIELRADRFHDEFSSKGLAKQKTRNVREFK